MDKKTSTPVKHYDSKKTCDGVSSFLEGLDEDFRAKALAGMDPGRVVSLHDFHSFVSKHPGKFATVGVISGIASEPELALLESLPTIDWGLTRFDGHLSLEVLLPRKDVCDASCETAGVPA